MHSRYSHVLYNLVAVNRAPFRVWLYKIRRSKSEMCRHGCCMREDSDHAVFHCPFVAGERADLRHLCIINKVEFTLMNLLTLPCLQINMERLLLKFICGND